MSNLPAYKKKLPQQKLPCDFPNYLEYGLIILLEVVKLTYLYSPGCIQALRFNKENT